MIKKLMIMMLVAAMPAVVVGVERISLNSIDGGAEWQLCPQDDLKGVSGCTVAQPGFVMPASAVPGVVPGITFTAYVNAGKEKDPNFADNIYRVDETRYSRPFWYRCEFSTPKSAKKGMRVWLRFDNTNRFADFYFNGVKLSGTPESTKDVSGHMMRTKYDVTHLLGKDGKNAVAVLIYDPDQKKTRNDKGPYGVACSPSYLAGAGWDWMPYVPGRLAGITGYAWLEVTGDVVMDDPWVRSELPTLQKANIEIRTGLKNASTSKRTVTLHATINPGNIRVKKNVEVMPESTNQIMLGNEEFEQLAIDNPRLWWPNGYGEPNLYECRLQVKEGGKLLDERKVTFGIKKYEYKMIDNKVGYPVMTFFINGQKLYLKGGNWGMSEYLLRCQGKEYEKKIKLHKELNYNVIRLWTGCVTDDEFYDYCDRYGIMVWNDFWLYVAYNDVAQPEAFKANALDKVRRLRNHPSIALWCGANETHPAKELDDYLRQMVAEEDAGDRMYKSCSNQDGLSGSGWWGNQPPRHHFETSGSNLAFNNPPYPYGIDYGYGMRSEIGMATFPTYESVRLFIPEEKLWPLPTDEQLKEDNDNVWNKHFFGREASNANPVNYRKSVDERYGKSANLEEFCEKAQLLNIEDMKGMYEAWNDKMWNDAAGLIIWMSQSAYPSFVWQTYDYYYDFTGAYWGAKKACEHRHIQWNSSNNSVKVINTTAEPLRGVTATATVYDLSGKELTEFGATNTLDVEASNIAEAMVLNFNPYNLARGKNTVSSSEKDGNTSARMCDGAAGSRWESAYSDGEWIYVDLGESQELGNVVIKWEAAYAQEYEIMLSDDAHEWRSVYAQKQGKGGTEEVALGGEKARYVKLHCTKRATMFGFSVFEMEVYPATMPPKAASDLQFLKLQLRDSEGNLLSENFYWRNGSKELDYTALGSLPEADVRCRVLSAKRGRAEIELSNESGTVAFANRIRLVDADTGNRILPAIMNDNYITLMPGERRIVDVELPDDNSSSRISVLVKQYGKTEKTMTTITDKRR